MKPENLEDIFKLARNAFSLLTQRRNYRRLPTGSWWRGLMYLKIIDERRRGNMEKAPEIMKDVCNKIEENLKKKLRSSP